MFGVVVSVARCVTVEPMLIIYYIAASIESLAGVNLLLQKACNPHYQPDADTPCANEVESQKIVTTINTWRPTLEYTIPVVFILFVGPWSDSHGKRRKPLLFLPIIGEILTTCFVTLSVYMWSWSPEVTAVFECIFRGITGGRTCFSIGAATYIADITSSEERTFRLGIITALIFIATPVGNALGGYLRVQLGFYAVFTLCLCMNIIAVVIGLILVKNPSTIDSTTERHDCWMHQSLQMFKTVVRKRDGHKRLVLLLMLIVSPLFGACLIGEYSVLYFFLRYKFNWGEVDYGFYSGYRMSLTFFGTLISIGILSKLLKVSDPMIGLLASLTQVIAALGNSFAAYSWQMFLFPALDLMHGAIYTVGRSIVSKSVDPQELGQFNSVLGVADSIFPLVVFPLYNIIYKYTFESMPGEFFLISVLFAAVTMVIFAVVIVFNKEECTLNKNGRTTESVKT